MAAWLTGPAQSSAHHGVGGVSPARAEHVALGSVTTTWKDKRRGVQSRSGAMTARPVGRSKRVTPADARRSVWEAGW